MVEVLAVEKALELTLQKSWKKVAFSGDSKIIDSITNPYYFIPLVIYALIQKTKDKKDHLTMTN